MLETLAAAAPVSTGLSAAHWLAVLRIALGLWWLESFRHKNKQAWFQRGSGIAWAKSVADKHRWAFVTSGFNAVVAPRAKAMSYVIVFSEFALGFGLTFGFLTPVAAAFSVLLNLSYFVLMIHDWAEQGQNSMMVAMAVVVLGAHGWQTWSLDRLLHIF